MVTLISAPQEEINKQDRDKLVIYILMKLSSEGYKMPLVLTAFRMFKMRVVVLLHFTDACFNPYRTNVENRVSS